VFLSAQARLISTTLSRVPVAPLALLVLLLPLSMKSVLVRRTVTLAVSGLNQINVFHNVLMDGLIMLPAMVLIHASFNVLAAHLSGLQNLTNVFLNVLQIGKLSLNIQGKSVLGLVVPPKASGFMLLERLNV